MDLASEKELGPDPKARPQQKGSGQKELGPRTG
jgi:hypothetical protein